jgi:hypothetical protein
MKIDEPDTPYHYYDEEAELGPCLAASSMPAFPLTRLALLITVAHLF